MLETYEEILQFAITREIEAYEFYTALAMRMSDPEKKEMFEDLAADELKHKANLELELMKAGEIVAIISKDDFNTDDYHIESDIKFDMEYKDILHLAIEKEDAAFRLYASLSGQVQDEASSEVLLQLAEEEIKHKTRMEFAYKNFLKRS
jgi:rubrerythrin